MREKPSQLENQQVKIIGTWTDYILPTKDQMSQIAAEFNLPPAVVYNCLDPDYLPQLETYGESFFLVLRYPEPEPGKNADTVQELTTKVAVFINQKKMVTLHRKNLDFINSINEKLKQQMDFFQNNQNYGQQNWVVLKLLFEQVGISFDQPLSDLEKRTEFFEEKIFDSKKNKYLLREGYYIKRMASSYKKVIKFTLDIITRLYQKPEITHRILQQSRDSLERCLFYADDVQENVQGLLNLHMSIESQKTNEASFKTNEIVRVLTVLTIFFLPLNFLAGVYGMNFTHIPYLDNPYGFWYALGLMLIISFGLALYVLSKGWMTGKDIKKEQK